MKFIFEYEYGNDRSYDAAETYMEYKQNATVAIIFDILKNKSKNLKQTFDLAPIARINKIWADFARTGMVRDEKGIDMIGEIFIKNIAMLAVNTELCGHTPREPKYTLLDADDSLTPRQINTILTGEKFVKYITDYNGQLRISDYGLEPLEKLAFKFLSKDNTYEEKLITLDMMLNVVHQRSDLSRLFVEGGSASLDSLATNESKLNIKNLLREYFYSKALSTI